MPDATEADTASRAAARQLADQQAEDAEVLALSGLKRFPERGDMRLALAQSLLMQGRYREGFREFEGRFHRRETPARGLSYPEWDGTIAGRSILVCGEQGIGDEIQAVRFVRKLKALGASRVTLACLPAAVGAFQNVGADLVVPRWGEVRMPKHDYWTLMWSVPYRLGIDLDDISGEPYLKAEPRGPGGVGLVERGSATNSKDAERSMPAGMLQSAFPQGHLLEPEGDIYDSLCRVAALDLLITVDTSWAHMAGALGVPCWVLLPRRDLDWRWMRERTDSPWYDSLRLFRQSAPGDWSGPLEAVKIAAEEARLT